MVFKPQVITVEFVSFVTEFFTRLFTQFYDGCLVSNFFGTIREISRSNNSVNLSQVELQLLKAQFLLDFCFML